MSMATYHRDPWAVPRRDRWTSWQAEAAGTSHEPTVIGSLLALVVIVLLALALLGGPQATAQGADRPTVEQPSCVELARLQKHGYTSGGYWRATRAACLEARKAAATP
jgi:hypothetical protein